MSQVQWNQWNILIQLTLKAWRIARCHQKPSRLYRKVFNCRKSALYTAMKRGNEIHDELFEGEGVDVAVEDAVNMAGALCFVNSVGQGYDMFGHDCEDQLATVFEMLCTTQQSRCYAVVSSGRTMLLIVNEDGSCMIVDSHKHINHGAVIAYCPSNSVKMLAKWLRAMMQRTWQIDLRFCSVTPIFYVTP